MAWRYELWCIAKDCIVGINVGIPVHEKVATFESLYELENWMDSVYPDFNQGSQNDKGYYIKEVCL